VTGPGLSFTSPDKRSNIEQKAVGLQCFKINLGVAWVSTLNFGVLTNVLPDTFFCQGQT